MSLVIQTICATGIRVSELRFITAEAVQAGRTEVNNKGKRRTVFLSDKLRRLLKSYLQKQKITAGAVFVSKHGKPLDRSNIWRDMKSLCKSAGVDPSKPGRSDGWVWWSHNFRYVVTVWSCKQGSCTRAYKICFGRWTDETVATKKTNTASAGAGTTKARAIIRYQ